MRDATGQSRGLAQLAPTVDEKGRVSGTWADALSSGTLTGSVNREGSLSLVTHYQDGDTITEQGSTTLSGTTWQGTLAAQDPELAGWTTQFSMTRQ